MLLKNKCIHTKGRWESLNRTGSHPEVFYKKGILKNFVKFTGKHLCQNLFFNNVVGLKLQVAKRDSRTGGFLRILQKF